jgi:hypothetical protein
MSEAAGVSWFRHASAASVPATEKSLGLGSFTYWQPAAIIERFVHALGHFVAFISVQHTPPCAHSRMVGCATTGVPLQVCTL